jgi:hypothetical protein
MTPAWSAPLERLAGIDPAPFFVLSLLPYLAFLWWASRVYAFPKLALRGFQLTLLFVAVTIVAAIVAQVRFDALLADVDGLHGGAEAFLTLSNLLVMLGFATAANRGDHPDDQGTEGSLVLAAGPIENSEPQGVVGLGEGQTADQNGGSADHGANLDQSDR